jgi:hypothetical protein
LSLGGGREGGREGKKEGGREGGREGARRTWVLAAGHPGNDVGLVDDAEEGVALREKGREGGREGGYERNA